MPVHIQILHPGLLSNTQKYCPSGKAMPGMKYADMGKAKEHTTRFLEKVIEQIL